MDIYSNRIMDKQMKTDIGVGKEAWAGYGLAGYLALLLQNCPAENFLWLLAAVVLLTILSGVQRTLIKYLSWKYEHGENGTNTKENIANGSEGI